MMLHRHFEQEREKNLTTSENMVQKPVENPTPDLESFEQKRKGRPPKGEN